MPGSVIVGLGIGLIVMGALLFIIGTVYKSTVGKQTLENLKNKYE